MAGVPTIISSIVLSSSTQADGRAFGATTNSAAEVSNGVYKINLAAADLNANVAAFRFTASGADDRIVTIVTQP